MTISIGTQLSDIAATVIANLRYDEHDLLLRVATLGSVHSGRPGVNDRDLESLARAGLIAAAATVGAHTRYELTTAGAMIAAALRHRAG